MTGRISPGEAADEGRSIGVFKCKWGLRAGQVYYAAGMPLHDNQAGSKLAIMVSRTRFKGDSHLKDALQGQQSAGCRCGDLLALGRVSRVCGASERGERGLRGRHGAQQRRDSDAAAMSGRRRNPS
eukprot:176788-Chlamydomonas_euryale.AAC.4